MLHRDVKLDNILVSQNYEIKLCDFGISCKIEHGEVKTERCGTLAYMAPEILNQKYSGFSSDVI